MKAIITIFFTCVSMTLFSQTVNDSLICLPKQQIIDAAAKLRDAKTLNKKYQILTSEYKSYILEQDTIIQNFSTTLNKKDAEIEIYRKALGDYGIQNGKLVWYKNPKINFVLGVLTGGSLVYIGTRIFTK